MLACRRDLVSATGNMAGNNPNCALALCNTFILSRGQRRFSLLPQKYGKLTLGDGVGTRFDIGLLNGQGELQPAYHHAGIVRFEDAGSWLFPL
jgi:hypothetical protein